MNIDLQATLARLEHELQQCRSQAAAYEEWEEWGKAADCYMHATNLAIRIYDIKFLSIY